MPVLIGAVAYREDLLNEFEDESTSWELARPYEHPIACPKGGACEAIYKLLVEINASDETADEFVSMVLDAMEQSDCGDHPPRIRINAPSKSVFERK
jgi:hypothetical protein